MGPKWVLVRKLPIKPFLGLKLNIFIENRSKLEMCWWNLIEKRNNIKYICRSYISISSGSPLFFSELCQTEEIEHYKRYIMRSNSKTLFIYLFEKIKVFFLVACGLRWGGRE